MLAGRHPFDDNSDGDKIITHVLRRSPHPLAITDARISDAARDITRQLLKTDPDERLGAEAGPSAVKEHMFYRGLDWSSLLRKTLSVPLPLCLDGVVRTTGASGDCFSDFHNYSRRTTLGIDSEPTRHTPSSEFEGDDSSPASQKLATNLRHRTAMAQMRHLEVSRPSQ